MTEMVVLGVPEADEANENDDNIMQKLDTLISKDGDLDSRGLKVILDFTPFLERGSEMDIPKLAMKKFRHLLRHPLVEAFLHVKWIMTRKVFFVNVLFYIAFLTCLTILTKTEKCDDHFVLILCLTGIFLGYIFLRECLQLAISRRDYIFDSQNYLQHAIIWMSLAFLILKQLETCSEETIDRIGAWTVFLSWLEFAFLLGEFPLIGSVIYVSISVSLALFVHCLVYIPILVGFAMLFHLLQPSDTSSGIIIANVGNDTCNCSDDVKPFKDMRGSMIKVLSMMLGEFDTDDNFHKKEGSNSNESIQIGFIIFLIFCNIVIVNLLIALTVNKVDFFLKKAEIFRLKKTVEQVDAVENGAKCLPQRFFQTSLNEKLKGSNKIYVKPFDHFGDKLPIFLIPWKYIKLLGQQFIHVMDHTEHPSMTNKIEYRAYKLDQEGDKETPLDFVVPRWVICCALEVLRHREEDEKRQHKEKVEKKEREADLERILDKLFQKYGNTSS